MTRFARAVLQFFSHWPSLVAGFGIVRIDLPWLAVVWFAASRVAYVGYVGVSLRAQELRGPPVAEGAEDGAWPRFSTRASWLMDNDAIAFVALCVVTAGTVAPSMPWSVAIVVGGVLVLLGSGVKIWANASLSPGSYHWRNFFIAPAPHTLVASGPYRWVSNPMYTIGYAHLYGVALAMKSLPGLAAAVGAQASILLLHLLVERPHLHRLRAKGPSGNKCGMQPAAGAPGGIGRP